jgi:L-2,4-diaminobutyrate decarboxylase
MIKVACHCRISETESSISCHWLNHFSHRIHTVNMTYNNDPDLLTNLSTAAHDAVDRIIASYRNIATEPVLQTASPTALHQIRALAAPDAHPRPVGAVTHEAFDAIFPYRMAMNHPRSMCFITAPVSPLSWLGDLLTAGHNAHAGSWLQSSGPSAVEAELVAWLAERVGFARDSAGGLFVSGGSMANLVALVAARDAKFGDVADRARGVAYLSTQTHSSIAKALRIVGLGDERIKKVKADQDFRMDVADLRRQLEEDRQQGLRPFVIVANLGTTNTGSIDDLEAIADLSREFDLWMHVDGAYGASVVLSKTHQHLAKGLGRADSVSWDAHKWLFQTYDTGIVLTKDREALLRSFVNNAEYLRDALATTDQPNFW